MQSASRNVRPFVHLRVLSHYSLGHGLSSPAEICRHARRIGFDSVALTDVSGTHGFFELHAAAQETGIKPIYGTLLFLDWSNPPEPTDPVASLILLAIDRTGLRNVCAAATLSSIRRERVKGIYAADLEGLAPGVVAIAGVSPRGEGIEARHMLGPLLEMFHGRLFVERRAGLSGAAAAVQDAVLKDARELGIPPVLVEDVRFAGAARPQLVDLAAHAEERVFEHAVFGDRRLGGVVEGSGMATAAEMSVHHDEDAEAYTNAESIAALVQPDLLGCVDEPEPLAMSELEHAEDTKALRRRVDEAAALVAAELGAEEHAALLDIVNRELDAIADVHLEDALLQFERITRTARDARIRFGPATGLWFQSKVAFLLGLSAFDPYAITPSFVPDFGAAVGACCVLDLQVTPRARPRLLALLNRAFDDASIGYVPSVEHVTAARALRIAARTLDIPRDEVDDAARVATRFPGASLRELVEENRTIGAMYRRSAVFRELVGHAAAIEGLPYGFARTKRTLVLSPVPLRNLVATTVSADTNEHFVQATRESFPVGVIRRIDISTLHVLSVLEADHPPDVRETRPYALVSRDDLDGIYILESGPRQLARAFGIEGFHDLVHFVALLRQRGSDRSLGDRMVAFRGEGPAIPAADRVAELLNATNGWILFRDQLVAVITRLTGLAAGVAAAFLRRFDDHSPGGLAALRRDFLALTVEQSVAFEDATAWFSKLVRESDRALDRQRVIAEALLIHASLTSKERSPAEFFARMAEETGDDERRARYLAAREEHIIRMQATGVASPSDEFNCASGTDGVNFPSIDAVRAGAIEASMGRDSHDQLVPRANQPATPEPLQLGITFHEPFRSASSTPPSSPSAVRTSIHKDGNTRGGFRVIQSLLEFYPHPIASPVELAGRIRNFHEFKSSSGKSVGFFELFDSSSSVRVFVPWERVARYGEPLGDGSHVVVKGKIRLRDGRKVCDALEIVVTEGGNGNGETSPDTPTEGDP